MKETSFVDRYKNSKLNIAGIGADGKNLSQDSKKDTKNLVISISQLVANPNQPRKNFANLDELAESIREHGVLEPLLVRYDGQNFSIIAGERRFRAAQKVGLTELPCRVLHISEQEALEIALIENLQREDLFILEEALALKELKTKTNLTLEKLSQVLGKSTGYLSMRLTIAELPSDLQAILEKEPTRIAKSVLAKIAKEKDVKKQKLLLEKAISGGTLAAGRHKQCYKWRNRKHGFDLIIHFQPKQQQSQELLEVLQKAIEQIRQLEAK